MGLVTLLPFFLVGFTAWQTEPWTNGQLLEPADLASTIQSHEAGKPLIFSIGPGAIIKGSYDIGPTAEKRNLKKLEDQLDKLQREEHVVIYCGCCPFNKCPNIRPAFTLLNSMGFKNQKLLNLPQNIKVDWIDRGYPISE
jgi:hypothetical protein